MNKYFVCLTSSSKHVSETEKRQEETGRCMAGIEVVPSGSKWQFTYSDREKKCPRWIRPVSKDTETGAIPVNEALKFKLFDIICLENAEQVPDGAQTENYVYSSMELVRRTNVEVTERALSMFLDNEHQEIFINEMTDKTDRVCPKTYQEELKYSLMMIRSEQVTFKLDTSGKPRCVFIYKNNKYQFKVTDPEFRRLCYTEIDKANSYDSYYLVLSVGREFLNEYTGKSYHYKLVATVFPFHMQEEGEQIAESEDQVSTDRPITITTIAPKDITNDRMPLILDNISVLEKWIKEVKAYALTSATEKGVCYKGYSLKKFNRRKITNVDRALSALNELGPEISAACKKPTELKSINELMKILGEEQFNAILGQCIEVQSSFRLTKEKE